ncbi:hypothetical protein HYV79_00315 [Candidatus Woesearchaeota archaeon]|nr:hypothetical protein [Candidatus Woesearchaeota archaeon]
MVIKRFVDIFDSSIETYLELIKDLELPNLQQLTNFVIYVSDAHQPKQDIKPIYLLLYLDPYAGYGYNWNTDIIQPGKEIITLSQITTIPVKEWKKRFGNLSYAELHPLCIEKVIPELQKFTVPVTPVFNQHHIQTQKTLDKKALKKLKIEREKQLQDIVIKTIELFRYVRNN